MWRWRGRQERRWPVDWSIVSHERALKHSNTDLRRSEGGAQVVNLERKKEEEEERETQIGEK